MNKYFTNEYIELCKSKKVQNLWLNHYPEHCYLENNHESMESLIWLPDSDDLDDKIFKILENWSKEEDIEYSFEVSFIDNKMTAFRLTIENEDNVQGEVNTNPLVAKIKTLIDLLEAK